MQSGFIGGIISFMLLLSYGAYTPTPALQAVTAHPPTAHLAFNTHTSADLGQFAGTWRSHSAVLTIAPDGSASFEGRAYRWCGSGVPQPCDTIDAQGLIHNGDHEQIQLSRVNGSIAYGTITTSSFHPAGMAVSVTLQPNDTLLYANNTPISLLCGPHAPVGTCGA